MMKVEKNQVLWRTRGKKWDYGFISTPTTIPELIGLWYEVHKRIFSDVEVAPNLPRYKGGSITIDQSKRFFYRAVAVIDSSRRDQQGRMIAHYVVIFFENEPEWRIGWEAGLLCQLANSIDHIFLADQRQSVSFESFEINGSRSTDGYREEHIIFQRVPQRQAKGAGGLMAANPAILAMGAVAILVLIALAIYSN